MKLEIFTEKKTVVEKIARLRLEQGIKSGCVSIVAVDEYGDEVDCGNLISFYSDGTIMLNGSVNDKLGFQLDSSGRIKVQN